MSSEASPLARVLVVDASGVARLVAMRALGPHVQAIPCADAEAALLALTPDTAMVVTALRLPGMDGQALARAIRSQPSHAQMPILAVSGNVAEALLERSLEPSFTDYFDKSLGAKAMGAFFEAYLHPKADAVGQVMLVEDSRTIAMTTRRMLEKRGAMVIVVASAEDAIAVLDRDLARGVASTLDLVISDVNLSGELTGLDVIRHLRQVRQVSSAQLPVLVTTGDEKPESQAELMRAGADDVLEKPVREAQLLAKVRFHLWRSLQAREALQVP